jgi:hypothetical protein
MVITCCQNFMMARSIRTAPDATHTKTGTTSPPLPPSAPQPLTLRLYTINPSLPPPPPPQPRTLLHYTTSPPPFPPPPGPLTQFFLMLSSTSGATPQHSPPLPFPPSCAP